MLFATASCSATGTASPAQKGTGGGVVAGAGGSGGGAGGGSAGPTGTGGDGTASSTAGSGGEDPTGGSDGTGGSLFDGGPPEDASAPEACTDATSKMYLLGKGKELYRFDPSKLMLELVGVIDCPSGIAAPFSMTIDRKGLAWVLFDDGKLYHVSMADASCTFTGMLPGQQGFSTFGMGFVSDNAGGPAETLYLTEADIFGGGTRLGKLDPTTLTVSVVGSYDSITGGADATGTGDGKLFGFFRTSPVTVAEIDTATAKIVNKGNPAVMIGGAWAFAFWGGSFWLFTTPPLGNGAKLDKFDLATNTTTNVSSNIGFVVVGAGVSTCAPTKPPA